MSLKQEIIRLDEELRQNPNAECGVYVDCSGQTMLEVYDAIVASGVPLWTPPWRRPKRRWSRANAPTL